MAKRKKTSKPKGPSVKDVAGLLDPRPEDLSPELTGMQRLFVLEYCKDLNATRAAVAAGYAEKNAPQSGYQALRSIHVRAAVEERMMQLDEETRVSAGWIRKQLIRNARRAEAAGIRDGGSVLNKAMELLGRNRAMFLDRQDHTTDGDKIAQVVVYPSNGREIDLEDDDGEGD